MIVLDLVRVKREFVCPTVLLLHAIFMDLMLHLGLQTEKNRAIHIPLCAKML